MGDRRVAFAVVLCEDQAHATLAIRYLRTRFDRAPRCIRVQQAPPSGGSAEQYVRQRFEKEVLAYRKRANSLALCLLVVTDADTRTVHDRVASLEDEAPRLPTDRVALFVPKRNVETWAVAYAEGGVNEEVDYGPQPAQRIREAADRLAGWDSLGLESIEHALFEATNLDRF